MCTISRFINFQNWVFGTRGICRTIVNHWLSSLIHPITVYVASNRQYFKIVRRAVFIAWLSNRFWIFTYLFILIRVHANYRSRLKLVRRPSGQKNHGTRVKWIFRSGPCSNVFSLLPFANIFNWTCVAKYGWLLYSIMYTSRMYTSTRPTDRGCTADISISFLVIDVFLIRPPIKWIRKNFSVRELCVRAYIVLSSSSS